MANKKKDVYSPKPMTEGKKAVIQRLFKATVMYQTLL